MKYTILLLLPLLSAFSWSNSKPIVVVTNNWTSQIVLSHVYGAMLDSKGIPVSYLPSTVSEQWGALSHGVAHVQLEVWEGTMNQAFNRLTANGSIQNMGEHAAKTREDWWYPEYVETLCPGLPDWQALKRCAPIFANKKGGKGIYVAGPWEKPDEARIRALELGFQAQPVEHGDELWVALKAAYDQRLPIVLFNWSPNWVESRYAGKFVEFPDYAEACEVEASWGVNPDFLYDCGNPKGGWLKKAAWPGLQSLSSCAFDLLKTLSFTNAQIADAAAYVDVDRMSHQDAAQAWMKKNKTVWKTWLKVCEP